MLEVAVGTSAAHKSDRLRSRAEGPFTGLRLCGAGQGSGVRGSRLRQILPRVAGAARRGAGIILSLKRRGYECCQDGRQNMNRPLY